MTPCQTGIATSGGLSLKRRSESRSASSLLLQARLLSDRVADLEPDDSLRFLKNDTVDRSEMVTAVVWQYCPWCDEVDYIALSWTMIDLSEVWPVAPIIPIACDRDRPLS